MTTQDFLAEVRQAYDSGDILAWARVMADDEDAIRKEHGLPDAPNPWRKVVEEIERLRCLVRR